MLALAIGALAFLAVALGSTAVSRYLEARPSDDQRRAARRLRELSDGAAHESDEPAARGHRLIDLGARVGGWLVPSSDRTATRLSTRLALAGYRNPSAVLYFSVFQLTLVIALAALFGGVTLAWVAAWKKALLWTAIGGAFGLIAPSALLTGRVNRRQRELRNSLPDALDIMVLSIEGGAALNAALNWAVEEIRPVHPLLGSELLIVQREVQLGLSVGEAFRTFAERCGIAEARDLAVALLQSEKYGASVGKALRAHADAARQERQVWAEEVAQKASVKIIFPMLLCIFPAIFIVLLGPAAMQMSKMFSR